MPTIPLPSLESWSEVATLTWLLIGFGTSGLAGLWLGWRRRARTLADARGRQQAMIEQIPAVLYEADFGAAATWHMVSPRVAELLGFTSDEWMADPSLWLRQIHPDDRDRVMQEEDGRDRSVGATAASEYRMRTRDGREAWVRDESVVIVDEVGSPRLRGFMIDITARKRAELALRDSEEQQRQIIETASLAYVAIDARGSITEWNRQAESTFGWTREEAVGQRLDERIIPLTQRPAHRAGLARYLATGEAHLLGRRIEVIALHRDGHEFPCELSIWPVRVGETLSFSALIHDITVRKQLETQLQHQAFHDALTGLANRALFRDRVSHALARLGRRRSGVAVLFADLDDFKTVNDSLGHAAGDQLLVAVAERLRAVLRPEDTTARFGGDEFAILLEETALDGARRTAQRLLDALRSPFELLGRQVFMRASVGAAIATASDVEPDDLLRQADLAMYTAKSSGKGRFAVYEPVMHAAAVTRMEMRADLERALSDEELELHYQPIVELRSGRVIGVEALTRWRHGDRGLVAADEFIPIAEETGLIIPLGTWALQTACRQLAAWDEHLAQVPAVRGPVAHPLPGVSVNVSTRQLQEPGFVDLVADAVAAAGLEPGRLTIEITESGLMADVDHSAATLNRLKELGVRVAIDDFGTGYSSLSYLERLPVQQLKIDRSFVAAAATGPDVPVLVRSIVRLGQTLGLEVLAEGIETADQLRRMREVGCRLGQGFYFSAAVPPDEALAILDRPGGLALSA